MRRLAGSAFTAFAILTGCQSAPEPSPTLLDRELCEITALFAGDYVSEVEDGAREGRSIYMRVRNISAPDGADHAMYSEMRHDGPDGEFYRQVIYLFDETADRSENRMTAMRVSDADTATRLLNEPDLFARGGVETEPALSEDCYAVWTKSDMGFESWIDPDRCIITGRRGDQRRIEARTQITAQAIGQLERGYTLEGELLFGNPDGDLYVWPRVIQGASD